MQKEELLQAMAENTRGGGIVSDVEWCQNCGDVVTDDGCACAAIPKPTGVLTREQLEASCREYERLLEQKRATIEQQAQELERLKREFVNKDQIIASLAEQLAASQARCREMETELQKEHERSTAHFDLCVHKDTELAQLQATLAAREAEIVNLKTCQCEGCDMSLEGEAYCTRCVTKRVNELVSLLAACGATENIDGTLNFDATQFPVANRITEMQSDMRVLRTRVESLKAERDAAVQEAGRLREVLEYYAQTAIGARAIAALKAQQAAGDSPAGQTPPNFREAP